MNIGIELFREIEDNGFVQKGDTRKMMLEHIEAWKGDMKSRAQQDIRDVLLFACRNSSWVHQNLMSGEQVRTFLELTNDIKARYEEIVNKPNPSTAIMAEVVDQEMQNEGGVL